MKPKIFLSCSFREEDKDVVEFFTNILNEEFEVLSAKPQDRTDILEKIFPKIRGSEAVFVIFSKRHKIQDKKSWVVPPNVLIEPGYAKALDRPIFGIVEQGVHEKEQGILRFSSRNYPRFERTSLEPKRNDFKDYIKAIKKELSKEISIPYDYTYGVKDTAIYRNGYGVIRIQYGLRCLEDRLPMIITEHAVKLGKTAKKGSILPSLEDLIKGSPTNRRENKPFLAFRIIEGNVKDSSMKPILSETKRSTDKAIYFSFEFSGPFTNDEFFSFEYSCGIPDLFPVCQDDLKPGKRELDRDYAESKFILPPARIGNLTFTLRFEEKSEFLKEPIVKFFGPGGYFIREKPFSEIQKSTLYTVYVETLSINVPHGDIRAEWIPK